MLAPPLSCPVFTCSLSPSPALSLVSGVSRCLLVFIPLCLLSLCLALCIYIYIQLLLPVSLVVGFVSCLVLVYFVFVLSWIYLFRSPLPLCFLKSVGSHLNKSNSHLNPASVPPTLHIYCTFSIKSEEPFHDAKNLLIL